MTNYAHVTDGTIDEEPKSLPTAWRNVSGLHLLDDVGLKALGWLPIVEVGRTPFDPAIQVRTGPVLSVGDDEVTATYEVRAKTVEELAAGQRATDLATLREAGKDLAIVSVATVDTLIAKGVIVVADVEETARQAYQDLKVIAERVKAL